MARKKDGNYYIRNANFLFGYCTGLVMAAAWLMDSNNVHSESKLFIWMGVTFGIVAGLYAFIATKKQRNVGAAHGKK